MLFESFFYAILHNAFLQNAIISILLMSVIAGIIGSLLVSNNIVFIGGGIAHCAYGGIGVAIFYGFSVLLGASLSAIFVAFCFALIRNKIENSIDTFSAILWALGMSIGVLFFNLSSHVNTDVESYLFGSILSVDSDLIHITLGFDSILVLFIILYYREILNISYDSEFCQLKQMKVNIFTNTIFCFIAIGIILSMQLSGLILVLAMLSIPAYIGNIITKTLKTQMIISALLSIIIMFTGLFFAYQYNIPPGACMTLVGVCSVILTHIVQWIFKKG